jgi:hypothetical protein
MCPPLNVSTHIYEAMFGPRFSASLGKVPPFAEFEVGVGHINNGFTSDTAFATAVGGGFDYRILRPIAWRFQGDYASPPLFLYVSKQPSMIDWDRPALRIGNPIQSTQKQDSAGWLNPVLCGHDKTRCKKRWEN